MRFCIYCNYKVNALENTCPKCHRTLTATTIKNQEPPPFLLLNQNNTDKWQHTYGKKAMFNDRQTANNISHLSTLKLRGKMKICAHCHEKREADFWTSQLSVFYCRLCLTEKLQCFLCKKYFHESDQQTYYHYNQQLWHENCFKCYQCATLLKPSLTVLDKEGFPSCRTCQLKKSVATQEEQASTPTTNSRSLSISLLPSGHQQKESSMAKQTQSRYKRPCKQCGLHVSKKDYRGLKTQTGQVLCFHHNCLLCSKCDQHFQSLVFYTDGEHFYHPECARSQYIPLLTEKQQQDSPDTDYPPHDIPHASSYVNVGSFSDELKQQQSIITCHACDKLVTDTYLELANNFYHKECLLCAGCKKSVPTETRLTKVQGNLYCDPCSLVINKKSSVATPSDIFKSRKTRLPRLGGVRTCAGCKQGMPFSDYQPGPNASRWHKKCLRCAGCRKQMDSDAHMTVNGDTGLHSVHCRDCLDETPKPNYVR